MVFHAQSWPSFYWPLSVEGDLFFRVKISHTCQIPTKICFKKNIYRRLASLPPRIYEPRRLWVLEAVVITVTSNDAESKMEISQAKTAAAAAAACGPHRHRTDAGLHYSWGDARTNLHPRLSTQVVRTGVLSRLWWYACSPRLPDDVFVHRTDSGWSQVNCVDVHTCGCRVPFSCERWWSMQAALIVLSEIIRFQVTEIRILIPISSGLTSLPF